MHHPEYLLGIEYSISHLFAHHAACRPYNNRQLDHLCIHYKLIFRLFDVGVRTHDGPLLKPMHGWVQFVGVSCRCERLVGSSSDCRA